MPLSDIEITNQEIVFPCHVNQVSNNGTIPFGLSSYGYDIRVGHTFQLFERRADPGVLDPKNFDQSLASEVVVGSGEVFAMPPHSFALGWSCEWFKIPRNVIALCIGKSTYARCGLIVNTTPLEPGWQGCLTLELINPTPHFLNVYPAEGIAQVLFFDSSHQCSLSYAERAGRYMNQGQEVVFPRRPL